jgi:hypothetical protein
MARSWRWVAGEGMSGRLSGVVGGKELEMGRSWRWEAGDGEEWKIEKSLRWGGFRDGEELEMGSWK